MRLVSFRVYLLFTAFAETAYFAIWPFWSFKDADRGTLFDRAAALRHNVGQRQVLVGYAMRWLAICAGLLCALDLADYAMTLPDAYKPMWLGLMVGAGLAVALASVMVFEIVVVYAFLSRAQTLACDAEAGRYR